jgi:lipoate-protein ligase A
MASRNDPGKRACRLLIDPPAGGAWNMAVDEVLLQAAATENRMSLRFYAWSEPTLSLGYFQRYQTRSHHPASLTCACVRRATGGGAILHDREITYSVAVPPSHPLARSAQSLYAATHGSLVECLRGLGFDASLAASSHPADASRLAEPFMCFARRAAGDVIIGSQKIAGSAQRRWRGAVLQHGGILLTASPAAEGFAGLNDFRSGICAPDELIERWRALLPGVLESNVCCGALTGAEHSLAAQVAATKYQDAAWTQRR